MNIRHNYTHTLLACYIGFITQAIINNFTPLLFLTFQRVYRIPLEKIALLVTANFGVQLAVDLLSAFFVDRIGYRFSIVAAHIVSAVGLWGLGVFPQWFPHPYSGLLAAFSPFPLLNLIGCALCGVAVGIFWPGTLSLAAQNCLRGGSAMFALLALAGDVGCVAGPTLVGLVAGAVGDNLKIGLAAAMLFPFSLLSGLCLTKGRSYNKATDININNVIEQVNDKPNKAFNKPVHL
ncbi:MFS transporter [Capillibacterium thermochitinicola]|uniref:Major Facilitator Superfamily protein n=1 Tax=Capillibacterium thermochitinicola TaxID=2699427 RepID=A0A8J6I304_9FIRM|nr:MFS transporter [Capillibacterium thermochitinicola]MBA2133544.1 hypothetical protein [Capillibacterium thermochitinicola]